MKTSLQQLLFLFCICFSFYSFAQGIIVNEGGNGQGGNRDYFELLVIGGTGQTTGTVDLTDWIIDDNNGDFGGEGSGKGIAQGHIRLKSSCFSAMPIGAIIIIFNGTVNTSGAYTQKDPLIPNDDPTDANGDLVYIFPHTSTCFERCAATPNTNTTAYNATNCAYAAFPANQWDNTMALGSSADAFQTRKPDATFFHGFSYGFASSSIFPTYPAELGGGTGKNIGNAAGNTSINYNCGLLSDASSYARVAATVATPGAANSTENQNLITNIRQGTFDYSDWANPDNCIVQPLPTLPLELIAFEAKATNILLENSLVWELEKVDPFSKVIIQRANDAMFFEDIAELPLEATMEYRQYNYKDHTPFYKTYYRLKFEEPNAPISYSNIQVALHKSKNLNNNIVLYPNPANTTLNILLTEAFEKEAKYQIVDVLGRGILQGYIPAQQVSASIELDNLPSGIYFLQIESNTFSYTIQKFIKS